MAKVLIEVPYSTLIEVDSSLITALLDCKLYKKDYNYATSEYEYKEEVKETLTLHVANITPISPQELELQNILEENNRLTRENENLQAKLDTIYKQTNTSKELSL